MATAWFGPCPHCKCALSYLQGVTGSTTTPACPECREIVAVSRATLLMSDHSRPVATAARADASPAHFGVLRS